MPLTTLDHVNVRTARLEEMVRFYEQALGMHAGERPPFPFGGAWLYVGTQPVVHLVALDAPEQPGDPQIEHVAFLATGLAEMTARLEAAGAPFERRVVPGVGNVQLFVRDPDGNRIEIQFDASEA